MSNTLLFVTIDCNELIRSSSFNIIVHCSFKMICFRLTNTCDDILSMVEKVNRACDLRVSLTVGCLWTIKKKSFKRNFTEWIFYIFICHCSDLTQKLAYKHVLKLQQNSWEHHLCISSHYCTVIYTRVPQTDVTSGPDRRPSLANQPDRSRRAWAAWWI